MLGKRAVSTRFENANRVTRSRLNLICLEADQL